MLTDRQRQTLRTQEERNVKSRISSFQSPALCQRSFLSDCSQPQHKLPQSKVSASTVLSKMLILSPRDIKALTPTRKCQPRCNNFNLPLDLLHLFKEELNSAGVQNIRMSLYRFSQLKMTLLYYMFS